MVAFRVNGIPAPQGSKIRTRYGMFEASKRVKPWREAVIATVKNMEQIAPPYAVTAHFFIPRPKSTRAAYPVAPSIGDVDKMLRATLDGLTQGGVITDDRHVVEAVTSKQWAGEDGPGAVIQIRQVTG